MSCMSKRCGNCAHYFINRDWEKWCADEKKDDSGNRAIQLIEPLGMMGDTNHACPRWIPSEGYNRLMADHKRELEERRAARKAAKAKEAQS